MHSCRTYLALILLGILPLAAYCTLVQDTIPPVFTTLPSDTTIVCHTDVNSAFLSWLSANAFSEADNGEANIVPSLSQANALDSLQAVIDTGCSGTGSVSIGFIATDSCGNQSIEFPIASFVIVDNTPPSFVTEPRDLEIECTSTAGDSLQRWIDDKGNATLADNCSTELIWTNYTWEDNLGNTGFSSFSDSTNISILRENCQWSVTVAFFAQDECGNNNASTATFSILADNEFPEIIFTPADTTILCDQVNIIEEPIIIDGCDGILNVIRIDSSTQSMDSLACSYYNYELYRTWSAIDVCGNETITSQTVSVRDTIKPQILYEQTVAVNCDVDLSITANFISATDNCSDINFSFRDSLIFNSSCQNQITRSWIAADFCENIDSVTQIIQVQDFSGPVFTSIPRDTIILCESNNPQNIFEDWISNFAGAKVADDCNDFFIKGLPAKVYTDTSEIVMTNSPNLILQECTNTFGATSTQQVSFVAYDLCGNITQREALFTIIDNESPVVSNCPADYEIKITDNKCSAQVSLTIPSFTDNCLTNDDAKWQIAINNILLSVTNQQNLTAILEVGENLLDYTLTDCGGNSGICKQVIIVTDNSPPELTCPDDKTIYLPRNNCEITYTTEEVELYVENCPSIPSYNKVLPGENEFLEFTFNSVAQAFQTSDFILDFTDVNFENILFKPQLKINYLLDLGDNSRIEIIDESGVIRHTITSSTCTPQSATVDLPESLFMDWAENNTVRFIIVNQASSGTGTSPCSPDNISSSQGTDNESYFRLQLSYGDLSTEKELTNLQTGVTEPLQQEIVLEPGLYDLRYSAMDNSQNQSSCTTSISVVDTISPKMLCDDVIYVIDPLLEDFYPILESDLLFIEDDNCGIENLTFSPREVSCSDNLLTYTISATDIYGNSATCQALINIETAPLEPTFLSGLCFADTLKLIANLPPNLGFRLEWEGPSDFKSTVKDPILSGITGDSSGEYLLRATSPEGCIFEGTIDIDVSEFDSPEIFSNLTTICSGEELLLNTNSFTEIVDYLWYEGLSPNGTLIGQTTGPSFTLNPITGDHLYYVEVEGNGCNSNPSNTLSIQVTPPPLAEIQNPFMTLCQGEDLTLIAANINTNFTYTWSGPDNFQYIGTTPPPISNVSLDNQGTYTLTINQGDCISNTASAQVVILPNPIQPIIDGESIFCDGQTAVLTVPNVTSGNRYLWYLNGVLFSSVTSNSLLIPAINNSQSGLWTVVVENGICSSPASNDFQVNVESSLNIGATNDGPHCEGDEVLLTCSFIPGATYRWIGPNGESYDGRIVSAPATEGVYTVTVTTASNCQAITNTTLSVGRRPTITALSNTSLPCMSGNMSVKLVPTVFPPGNYEYRWAGPNNFSSNLEEPFIPNVTESDNGIYTLIVIQNNCESLPLTTSINITNRPEVALLTGNQDPCLGDDITIFISNPTQGNETSWIWTTPQGIVETNIPQLTIPLFTAVDNGNYNVVQQKKGCRSSESETFVINLQSEPIKPIIETSELYCAGENLTLSISEEDSDQYIWFTPNGTIILTEPRLVISELDASNDGAYSVYLIEGNCTSDTSDAIFLEVLDLPESVSFLEREIEICSEEVEELTICIEQNNADFEKIVLTDLNSSVTLQESTSDCFDLSFILGSTSEYNLTAYAERNGCRSILTDTISISIYNIPNTIAEVLKDTIFVCNQDFISIEADIAPPSIDLLWNSKNPDINFFNAETNNVSISNLESGSNEILLNSSNGICTNFHVDTLILMVLSEPEAIDDNYDLAYDENIILTPLLNDNFSNNLSVKITTEPENGTLSVEGTRLNFTPPLGYIGSQIITYQICDLDCPDLCAEAQITLTVGENVDCFVGNVITPNDDGYNDLLTVPCLQTGSYPFNSLIIFNQWGDEVFANSPYENDWKGEHKGKQLPASTYFYILDLGDGSKPIQGYIILEY